MSSKDIVEDSDNAMILFPKATILRIAKKNHPKLLINKDAQEALQHSATLYLNYIYSLARITAVSHKRKTISLEDIFEALDSNGLDTLDLRESTKELLEKYELGERTKKKQLRGETAHDEGQHEEAAQREVAHDEVME